MMKSAFFVLAATLIVAPAYAHPRLIGTNPAANATVGPPAAIALSFNERVVPRFTGATVTMTTGSGAGHAVTGLTPAFGADGKTLKLASAHPLTRGSYNVAWHAVGSDTHRVAGSFAFRVQ